MPESTIKFRFERDTKNTRRFAEEGDAPLIGTLYVSRIGLRSLFGAVPEVIELTIKESK